MIEKLRVILESASETDNDLWRQTNVAAKLLLQCDYEGYDEDITCLEEYFEACKIESGFDLEAILSKGDWHFKHTREWAREFPQVVTDAKGNRWEVACWSDTDPAALEVRLLPDGEWQEANWGIFCQNHGVDPDTLA